MRLLGIILPAFLLILLMGTPGAVSAQRALSSLYDSIRDKSELRIGLRYTSDYLYMGRSDSAKAPYLSGSLGYYHKSGIFINGSLSYLTAEEEGRVDLFALSGGYNYWGRRFATGLFVSEYFFSDQSYAIQAEMNTYLNAFAAYDFSLLMFFADASIGISNDTDVFIGAELNRTFYTFKNKVWITPAVSMNAGTQQYYHEYFTSRAERTGLGKGKGKGGNGNNTPNSQQFIIADSDKFRMLDYEASLQVIYSLNYTRLFSSATWTFPLNPSSLVTEQATYQEELEKGFFWSAGVRVSIY